MNEDEVEGGDCAICTVHAHVPSFLFCCSSVGVIEPSNGDSKYYYWVSQLLVEVGMMTGTMYYIQRLEHCN